MAKTILVVDDDRAIRETTAEILTMMGYDVLSASGVEEGLAILLSPSGDEISIILSDLEMRPLNGINFFEKIKDRGIPFVLMSGAADAPELAQKNGILYFLEKPIEDLEDLKNLLSSLSK